MTASLPVSTSTSATPAFVGSPLRVTGDAHQSAEGLDDEVVPGQRRASAPLPKPVIEQ